MLTALAATVAIAATGPASFGMAASPAAYDAAVPHHTYAIRITDLGTRPMRVRAALTTATASTGASGPARSLSGSPSWAQLAGPSAFRLRPHQSRTVRIRIGAAPAGRSELVAAFIATRPHAPGAVATSGGVGTALRFSQPGHTASAARPCPRKPTARRSVVAAPAHGGMRDLAFAAWAGAGALVLGGLAFFGGQARERRRRRHSTA